MWLWTRLKGYVAAAGVALAFIVGAFLCGRSDGKAAADAARAKRDAEARQKARKVEDEINGLGDDAVSARLDKWLRDKR